MGNLIVANNNHERSGLVKNPPKVEIFISNGTWNCPVGHTRLYIEAIGGGGSGAGGAHPNQDGGGGGGGASIARKFFAVESVSETLTVVVGAEVNGGATDTNGTAGNFSSVAISSNSAVIIKAYGGGLGSAHSGDATGGGGGAGTGEAGQPASGATAGRGGKPTYRGRTASGDSAGGEGGYGGAAVVGGNAEYGGGGGGGGMGDPGSSTAGVGGTGGKGARGEVRIFSW